MGTYCGDFLPPSKVSSSNHLFFHLYADHSGTGAGFKLEYSEYNPACKILFFYETRRVDCLPLFLIPFIILTKLLKNLYGKHEIIFSADNCDPTIVTRYLNFSLFWPRDATSG